MKTLIKVLKWGEWKISPVAGPAFCKRINSKLGVQGTVIVEVEMAYVLGRVLETEDVGGRVVDVWHFGGPEQAVPEGILEFRTSGKKHSMLRRCG